MLRFILNDQAIQTSQPAGSTVLDFVRYHKMLKGTKIGCREGDCGACTVLVGDFEHGKLVYRSMTSCLMPLGNAQGKHIVTVEGINMQKLSPVQQAIVDTNGTQCGFCTLGFVMSFTGFVLHPKQRNYEDAIAAIDGNICRCTGYKSLERAAAIISSQLSGKPEESTVEWLVKNNFLPEYFNGIEERLKDIGKQLIQRTAVDGAVTKMMVGGGTDLVVQKPGSVKRSPVHLMFDTNTLKGITSTEGKCLIGASVTVSEFVESSLIREIFPQIKQFIKLVSSTPIRNMATIAGNIVNASPIGDMSVFFLALDAGLILNKAGEKRTIALKDFYRDYKQTAKQQAEHVEQLVFTIPGKDEVFNFEKVSRRTHLDIASVNSACLLRIQNNIIHSIHLSAGGVAPYPKYLKQTKAFLEGKEVTGELLKQAIEIMNEEIAPITDVRGTADYKRLLLRQLFLSHMRQFQLPASAIKQAFA